MKMTLLLPCVTVIMTPKIKCEVQNISIRSNQNLCDAGYKWFAGVRWWRHVFLWLGHVEKDAVSVCWLVLSYYQARFISKMQWKGSQITIWSVDIYMFLNRINSCAARGTLPRHALFTRPPPAVTVAKRSKINIEPSEKIHQHQNCSCHLVPGPAQVALCISVIDWRHSEAF